MLRATFDTNVYVSGLNFKGKPYELLNLARSRQIEVAVSDAILSELHRVLDTKFRCPEKDIVFVDQQIRGFAHVVVPEQKIVAVHDDPADDRILECSVAAVSDFIVTGDRHLLTLVEFRGARIVAPADFLEIELQRKRT